MNSSVFYFSILIILFCQLTLHQVNSRLENVRKCLNSTDYELNYSWKLIEKDIKKTKEDLVIDKIVIYNQELKYKYYYSLFNPQTNEISIHLAIMGLFMTSGHETGHSLNSNEQLNITNSLKFHNTKFTQINELVRKWFKDRQIELKHIALIDYYETQLDYNEIIYLIKTRVNEKPSFVYIVMFEEKEHFEIIKSYD